MTDAKRLPDIPLVPKKPSECTRHHWSQRINLRTGEPILGAACWHCGTPEPEPA